LAIGSTSHLIPSLNLAGGGMSTITIALYHHLSFTMLTKTSYKDVPTKSNGKDGTIRIYVIEPNVPEYPQAKFPGCKLYPNPLISQSWSWVGVVFSEIYQVTGPVERSVLDSPCLSGMLTVLQVCGQYRFWGVYRGATFIFPWIRRSGSDTVRHCGYWQRKQIQGELTFLW